MTSKQLKELLMKIYHMEKQHNVKVKDAMQHITNELNQLISISREEKNK